MKTYEETGGVASVLLIIGGALPAVLPLAAVVLALDGSSSASVQLCGGSCSGAGDGGGDEEDLGELHVCWWDDWKKELVGWIGIVERVECDVEMKERGGISSGFYIPSSTPEAPCRCVFRRGIAHRVFRLALNTTESWSRVDVAAHY